MLWTEPLVICGFGDVGSAIAARALSNGRHPHQVTVVEQDHDRARLAGACGYRVIAADATSAEILLSAGARVASNIIVCLGDESMLEAVHAVRFVAPKASLQVVLNRARDEQAAKDAGADVVLNLSKITGKLLADAALGHPAANDASETG